MEDITSKLLDSMEEFLAYTRRKIGDDALAADVLQNSLLKALRGGASLRDEDRLLPWFYRILNNTITDLHRARQREQKYLNQYASEAKLSLTPEEEAAICTCMRPLLSTLKPAYAEVIQALDFEESEPETVARRLGITRGNLKVRHHRARQQLRTRLEESCRTCARHGCIDCTCKREHK